MTVMSMRREFSDEWKRIRHTLRGTRIVRGIEIEIRRAIHGWLRRARRTMRLRLRLHSEYALQEYRGSVIGLYYNRHIMANQDVSPAGTLWAHE